MNRHSRLFVAGIRRPAPRGPRPEATADQVLINYAALRGFSGDAWLQRCTGVPRQVVTRARARALLGIPAPRPPMREEAMRRARPRV